MQPTTEQMGALNAFLASGNLRLSALAGSGKTSTLTLMANNTHYGAKIGQRGLALAFNRAMADELAQRMPPSCASKSSHALAFRHCLGLGYTADRLGAYFAARDHMRGTTLQKSMVAGTLRRFYNSDAVEIENWHVPDPNELIKSERHHLNEEDARHEQQSAKATAIGLWEAQQAVRGTMPIGHDGYYKIWSLTVDQIPKDYLFIDEAQDTNGALRAVIARQRCQVILVGDRHQELYGWRGSINAMERFNYPELPLTQSWRFGEEIAHEATLILRTLGETMTLRGNPAKRTRISAGDVRPDAVLCRTNAGAFDAITRALDCKREVYADKTNVHNLKMLAEDAARLKSGRPSQGAELFGFRDWREVVDFSETRDGGEFKTLVTLVEKYGTDGLSRVLSRIASNPRHGSVTVSTVHRAKGLQWASVKIADDFVRGDLITDAERRLMYVAITRAQDDLMIERELLREYQA